MCPANGCTVTCTLEHDPVKVVLKESEPQCVPDVPLHVLACAIFVIIVVVRFRIKTPVAETTITINKAALIIHVIALNDV
jgi:hypothetical protein